MADSVERDTEDAAVEARKALTLRLRLLAARTEVKSFIEKDKTQQIKKENKVVGEFGYISHDAVTAHIRDVFNKYRILVFPSVVSCKNNGNRVELEVDVEFENADNPEDVKVIRAIGYGCDNQDKGPGKAETYAVKTAYLKVMMLQSKDDIEAGNIHHDPDDPRASDAERARDEARAAYEKAAKGLQLAIQGAQTQKELRDLQHDNKDFLMEVPEVTRDHFINLIQTRMVELSPEAQNLGAG